MSYGTDRQLGADAGVRSQVRQARGLAGVAIGEGRAGHQPQTPRGRSPDAPSSLQQRADDVIE